MKNNRIYTFVAILAVAALAFGCQLDDSFEVPVEEKVPISLKGDINQLAVTRASDNGFAAGDQVGIWAVNYNEDTPGTLTLKDNQATNVRFTFDGSSTWTPDYDIYYKDKNTKVDIYGIYPYTSAISSIEAQPFEVQEDQSTISSHGSMGGYEASDFLWAKHEAAVPSPSVIQLLFQHKMSCVVVTLEKGTGFADGEFEALSQSVLINNVKRSALINLSTGEVTATGAVSARSTVPAAYENGFRAIVVPQTVSSANSLFSITLGGTAYTYSEGSAFTYVPGKQHNFTVTVDKKPDGGYNVTVQTTISAWTNDNSSHEFTAKEYVVVNVETPGTLGETLTAAGKNPDAIKFLKVLGTVNAEDFYFMRDNMALLQGVNMHEVIKVEEFVGMEYGKEDAIPENAFRNKSYLSSFIFPDNSITYIDNDAFRGTNLSGALVIPNGVTDVDADAFMETNISSVSLPESLSRIHANSFWGCRFLTEFNIPESVTVIEHDAFSGCPIAGSLHLPTNLECLERSAFSNCVNLTGTVIIPSKITVINESVFNGCKGITSVQLHDGIKSIENTAFAGSGLRGEMRLPSQLVKIGDGAFCNTLISGNLILPETLVYLGRGAFKGCHFLEGSVKIPTSVRIIDAETFSDCSSIQEIVLDKDMTNIGSAAFRNCFNLNSIICLANTPPTLSDNAFSGVSKENSSVEVPESSVNEYTYTYSWNEFKRITAHRDFSISRRLYKMLNSEESRTFILRAESGASWNVEDKPDWVTVSPSSGTGKTEVTVTVNSLTAGSGDRTGEVVFLLDGKDYRSTLTVEQYDYNYSDGSVVTKQTHTKGLGIPIVFLGDCYDAADIASGSYLADTEEAIGYFFDIEPYKTYKDYFDVYIVFGKSEDSGVGSVNTIREAKFGTQYSLTGGALQNSGTEAFNYARLADPSMDIAKGLVVMVLNSTDYGGVTYMWNDGSAIAICPKSADPYPFDFRGIVQHEAGGHGLGKLADEYIYVNAFIDACTCGYEHLKEFRAAKANGWYKNLSETANRDEVPWSHLMYHPTYSNTVDIYEGGFFHTRGIFRSEPNSCMNNNIPYYSAISRQAIVERIMDYAEVPFNLDDFYANDAAALNTRASVAASPAWVPNPSASSNYKHQHPIIMGDHPNL